MPVSVQDSDVEDSASKAITQESKNDREHDLYNAIQLNESETALQLIELDVSTKYVDHSNKSKWTMLHWAAYHGNEQIVEALLNTNAASEYKTYQMKCRMAEDKDCTNQRPRNKSHINPVAMNTPLHRAAQRGHLQVCWLLLMSSFSLADIDRYGNTPLHLAAAHGHHKVVECFIEDGADVKATNQFHLNALQVASTEACRFILRREMKEEKSVFQASRRDRMHQQHVEKYTAIASTVQNFINENIDDGGDKQDIALMKKTLDDACDFGVASHIIRLGRNRVKWLELERQVKRCMFAVEQARPTLEPTEYEKVATLQNLLTKVKNLAAKGDQVPPMIEEIMAKGHVLCAVATSEFWLHALTHRLSQYNTKAMKENDIKEGVSKLKDVISKTEKQGGSAKLMKVGNAVLERIISELDLQHAVMGLPTVRLPVPEMTPKEARNYWCSEDFGHIEQTECYPLPPEETGEYIWVQSDSLQRLQEATKHLQSTIDIALLKGADADLVKSIQEVFEKKSCDIEALQVKDEQDQQKAISDAQKAARKQKKKKKGKKQ